MNHSLKTCTETIQRIVSWNILKRLRQNDFKVHGGDVIFKVIFKEKQSGSYFFQLRSLIFNFEMCLYVRIIIRAFQDVSSLVDNVLVQRYFPPSLLSLQTYINESTQHIGLLCVVWYHAELKAFFMCLNLPMFSCLERRTAISLNKNYIRCFRKINK